MNMLGGISQFFNVKISTVAEFDFFNEIRIDFFPAAYYIKSIKLLNRFTNMSESLVFLFRQELNRFSKTVYYTGSVKRFIKSVVLAAK